jgi:hypothetical protein
VENDDDGDRFRVIKAHSSSCISKGTKTNLEAHKNENSAKSAKSEEIFSTSRQHWGYSEVSIIEAKQEYYSLIRVADATETGISERY